MRFEERAIWFIGPLILYTKKVLQGSTSCILGYKPATQFYISSTIYTLPPLLNFSNRESIHRKISIKKLES
ncbi:uncharacterized protein METZ01_LOCUS305749 [marine metagenome]|uniref:Uncharacterized protein n=1 Tax=marine metagenome TaxID=408172 RepID=A0A382MXN6_9ZZZZ